MAGRELWLREDLAALWQDRDPFVAAFAQQGETFRALEQRQTLAFMGKGRRYFIKRHRGVTWIEILKNLLQGRLPVVSARNEYLAIRKLESLGIRAPSLAGYGRRGLLPQRLASFLVTDDIGPHQSLEDLCRLWPQQPPAFTVKLGLLRQTAAIARTLHEAGVCHRDFYLCHLLQTAPQMPLTVIDLHRALIKPQLAERWKIKDVAGLYFSALEIGLTQRDLYRFMRCYRGTDLKETLRRDGSFWQAVMRRAASLRARELRRLAAH
jgi:heptose I phosphotransferase